MVTWQAAGVCAERWRGRKMIMVSSELTGVIFTLFSLIHISFVLNHPVCCQLSGFVRFFAHKNGGLGKC